MLDSLVPYILMVVTALGAVFAYGRSQRIAERKRLERKRMEKRLKGMQDHKEIEDEIDSLDSDELDERGRPWLRKS